MNRSIIFGSGLNFSAKTVDQVKAQKKEIFTGALPGRAPLYSRLRPWANRFYPGRL